MINAIVIEWKGPFNDPKSVDSNNMIYLITGNLPQGPKSIKIRYIGITKNKAQKRFDPNHVFNNIDEKDRKFWVGKIKYSTMKNYSDSEWILVYYLDQQKNSKIDLLNIRKKSKPKNSICLINRWFKSSDNAEYVNYKFPFDRIPDMIYWDNTKDVLLSSNKICVDFDPSH